MDSISIPRTILFMINELPPSLVKKLKLLAERTCSYDDENFNANDWSGGNFDDAWTGGMSSGETSLAREILDAIDVYYKLPSSE